jgi:hypothetical protein
MAYNKAADVVYNTTIPNSSSRVEAYRNLFQAADEADDLRRVAGKIKAIGKLGGAVASAIGGAIDIGEDVSNRNYNDTNKKKAVAVDVVATATAIGVGLIVATLPVSIPVGIVIGVGASIVISLGGSWLKDWGID